jgi:hypothetical protein
MGICGIVKDFLRGEQKGKKSQATYKVEGFEDQAAKQEWCSRRGC